MVQPQEYLTYKGHAGQWSWILHRVTGVGVLIFLLAHVIDTAFLGWGPEAYNAMIALYRNSYFRVGEVVLAGAVLYHALNGIRICIIDFWPQAMTAHRRLSYVVAVVFFVIYIPAAAYMMRWVIE